MNKILCIIDMQQEFIHGVFGTAEAEKLAPKIAEYIKNFDGEIYITQDRHEYNEGCELNIEESRLPQHCKYNTEGFEINPIITEALSQTPYDFYLKDTFGSIDMCKDIGELVENLRLAKSPTTIYICGLTTDICVLSNTLMLRAFCPYSKIVLLSNLCAGTTPENHQKAIDIMKQCCIDIEEV